MSKPIEPYAHHCVWDGWDQFHTPDDPMPNKWDDAPPEVLALYALTPDEVAAVNAFRMEQGGAS